VSLLSDEKKRALFVEAVEGHPKYAKWEKQKKERESLQEEEFALYKKYAAHRRFVWSFETVALAANLEKVAGEEKCAGYKRLLEAEAGGFGK
jgi:hypothetical protein